MSTGASIALSLRPIRGRSANKVSEMGTIPVPIFRIVGVAPFKSDFGKREKV